MLFPVIVNAGNVGAFLERKENVPRGTIGYSRLFTDTEFREDVVKKRFKTVFAG